MNPLNRRSFLSSLAVAAGTLVPAQASIFGGTKKPKTVPRFEDPVNTVCDYTYSFVTHVTKEVFNMARINIEARCIIVEQSGKVFDYYKFASCKAEDSYTEANLFRRPNYDFSGIYTHDEYSILRTLASGADNYYDQGNVKDRFHEIVVDLKKSKVRKLESAMDIVTSTVNGYPLIARTEYEEAGRRIILEYPVKTMNVNQVRNLYQTDTGPIPYPDFSKNETEYIRMIDLVFIAFNKPDQASFIKQSKTAVSDSIQVMHYDETFDKVVKNSIMRVE